MLPDYQVFHNNLPDPLIALNSLNGVIAYATDKSKVGNSGMKVLSQFPEWSYSLCYTNTGKKSISISKLVSQFPEWSYSLCYSETTKNQSLAQL